MWTAQLPGSATRPTPLAISRRVQECVVREKATSERRSVTDGSLACRNHSKNYGAWHSFLIVRTPSAHMRRFSPVVVLLVAVCWGTMALAETGDSSAGRHKPLPAPI